MGVYEFVNVELALIALVRAQVRVDASVDIPKPRPAEFVQVVRVGGTVDKITDRPMVTFYVWGASWRAAHDLAALTRQRVHSVTRLADQPVYRVIEVGGLARAPDPVDGSPRYQFTAEYKLRGSTAP